MTAPATVRYPHRDIKLFFVSDDEQKCTYWILPAIYRGPVRLVELVRKIKPDCRIPDDRIYWQVYRRIKRLAALGYVTLEKRDRIDWQATVDQRMDEIEKSVHSIFADAVAGRSLGKEYPPRTVSSGTLTAEQDPIISTVKTTDSGFTVVPAGNLFTLLSRMQNSNHFLNPAKSRREMTEAKEPIELQKVQRRRRCPYYVSARTKWIRTDAIFRLRSIRRHSYFRRRDQRVVNPELVREMDRVQDDFGKYLEDVRDLKCVLQHRETGDFKILDYKTRFTDEDRKDQIIARYHRSWKKASQSYNTAVFLTLTSYPPSEAPKHQYRASLWHVDRHFPVSWNTYMSKLEKRERAARRDDLLDAMRADVRKVREVREVRERCWHCRGTGRITEKASCTKCNGRGYRIRVKLTRDERDRALEPMKIEYQILQKARELRRTDRLILSDQEYAECEDRISCRPRYLLVNEFMQNGLLHGHIVIFGRHWLDSFEQIKNDWRLTGQGERVHVYALHQEGGIWVWSKAAPKDARNRQPVDYLGKYLGKGVRLSEYHGMYWAVNKRFFSNSRVLTDDWKIDPVYEDLPKQYRYVRSVKTDLPESFLLEVLAHDHPPRGVRAGGGGGLMDPLGFGRDTGPGVPA